MVILTISAFANKASLRDKERAHYDNLERELIRDHAAKDRHLHNEYRINQINQNTIPKWSMTIILALRGVLKAARPYQFQSHKIRNFLALIPEWWS